MFRVHRQRQSTDIRLSGQCCHRLGLGRLQANQNYSDLRSQPNLAIRRRKSWVFRNGLEFSIFKSIESIIVLPIEKYSNFFDAKIGYDCDSCFLSFGNEGVAKVWNWKTGKLVLKQNDIDSFKIENIREKDAGLQPCIIQAFYVEPIETIVIVTTDRLIGFIQLNKNGFFHNEKQVWSPGKIKFFHLFQWPKQIF